MEFDDSPDEAAFRRRVRAFLDDHRPDVGGYLAEWPPRDLDDERDARFVAAARAWQRVKFDHGFAGLAWPVEYGGQGLDILHELIFAEEEGPAALLSGVFSVGIGMVGPTIIVHGSEAQKARFLGPLLRGDQVWCQLFSEPNAGSDLASLATKAVRDGDAWVIRGQKVWTSHAHYADWGILLARTEVEVPKHRGITCFLVDMRSAGIEIRPLRQATGSAEFNEVFLNDVVIADGFRLGNVNDGWRVALTTLASERASIGGATGIVHFDEVLVLAGQFGLRNDPVVRQELAAYYTRVQLLKWLGWRARTSLSRGDGLGPESSVMKLAMSRHLEAMGDLVLRLQGPAGMLDRTDA
ncbi:MAG: acyl-CoA dehydrogenase family protein, partial [Acidimicrobiales bacterium]|nr:acyl-CoA dehydrogenase family protein [Acidimicrobiales bacterium]